MTEVNIIDVRYLHFEEWKFTASAECKYFLCVNMEMYMWKRNLWVELKDKCQSYQVTKSLVVYL